MTPKRVGKVLLAYEHIKGVLIYDFKLRLPLIPTSLLSETFFITRISKKKKKKNNFL